jgi:hypothetical protein
MGEAGGCSNCKSKSGCDDRKGTTAHAVDAMLARLYPTRTWGEADDSVADGISPDDVAALADELAGELRAATFVQPGGDTEPCDYIWVLCLGRTPCIVQVRDHALPVPREWGALRRDGPGLAELYLRIAVSHRAPVAAVQQVALELDGDGEPWLVRERARAGVYDPPLLPRMQKLVAILPAYGLLHVDFGEIAAPPPGFRAGAWRELYGGDPAIANYLLFPQPVTMTSVASLDGRTNHAAGGAGGPRA